MVKVDIDKMSIESLKEILAAKEEEQRLAGFDPEKVRLIKKHDSISLRYGDSGATWLLKITKDGVYLYPRVSEKVPIKKGHEDKLAVGDL